MSGEKLKSGDTDAEIDELFEMSSLQRTLRGQVDELSLPRLHMLAEILGHVEKAFIGVEVLDRIQNVIFNFFKDQVEALKATIDTVASLPAERADSEQIEIELLKSTPEERERITILIDILQNRKPSIAMINLLACKELLLVFSVYRQMGKLPRNESDRDFVKNPTLLAEYLREKLKIIEDVIGLPYL